MPVSMDDAEFARLLAALPRQRGALLPALLLTQRTYGYVSDDAVQAIAAHLRLTVNAVEGVTTAYPDLRRWPIGSHVVRVCTGLSCWTAGGAEIMDALASALGIEPGQTTPDGGLTLEETGCAFVCAAAPVVEIDGVCHGRLDKAAAKVLISGATASGWRNRDAATS